MRRSALLLAVPLLLSGCSTWNSMWARDDEPRLPPPPIVEAGRPAPPPEPEKPAAPAVAAADAATAAADAQAKRGPSAGSAVGGIEVSEVKIDGAPARSWHIPFARASSSPEINADAREALIAEAKVAKRIEVRGRTDDTGKIAKNKRIAMARAMSVARMLEQAGVEHARITVSAMAHGDYLAPNDSEENRARNRRVDVVIVGRD